MPTYEYACKKCGIMEVFQSIKDAPLTVCPTCKAKGFQRMVTRGGGVIFKGEGFWETDYNRGADYQKKAKSDTATTPAADGGKDGKQDTKKALVPEPKPEPKPQVAAAPAVAPKPEKPAEKPKKT